MVTSSSAADRIDVRRGGGADHRLLSVRTGRERSLAPGACSPDGASGVYRTTASGRHGRPTLQATAALPVPDTARARVTASAGRRRRGGSPDRSFQRHRCAARTRHLSPGPKLCSPASACPATPAGELPAHRPTRWMIATACATGAGAARRRADCGCIPRRGRADRRPAALPARGRIGTPSSSTIWGSCSGSQIRCSCSRKAKL